MQDENGNQVTKSDEESNQVKGEKELSHPKLTKQQEDIRNFCSIPRTAQEIMDRLALPTNPRIVKDIYSHTRLASWFLYN